MKDFQRLIKKLKKRVKSFNLNNFFLLAYVGLILILFLTTIVSVDSGIKEYIVEKKIIASPVANQPSLYPLLRNLNFPNISAKAALVLDDDSKVVLFSKNPTLRFSMASTTKIMTAQVALDYYNADDVLSVDSEGVEGVNIGLKKGQRIKFLDLLYGMLLPSGNDAAVVIAQNYPGGEKEFVRRMNEKAKDYNLKNTHFGDAAGLLDDEDYTTALDLARLSALALKNELFAKTVATKHKVISDADGLVTYSINNLNKLLGIEGVNGIKTGYTNEAGQVLVTSKILPSKAVLGASTLQDISKTKRIIIVVMGSEDRFLDTKKLLELISENVTYLSIGQL